MNTTTKLVGGVGVALIVAGGVYVAMNQQPVISFSQAPYAHSGMTWQAGQVKPRYSGRYIVTTHQWGAYVVNVDTGAFKMLSPVGKVSPVFQPPIWKQMGEAWGSASGVAVTPFTAKWVVVWGAMPYPRRCGNVECVPRQFPDEVQVLRLDPPGFRFVGSIHAPKVGQQSEVVIRDDVAWVKQKEIGIPPVVKWTTVDLDNLTVLLEDGPGAPALVLQPDIDGYTYSIAGVYPTPIPSPWPGFQQFRLTRQGGGGPTSTPSTVTTAAATATVGATTRTPTRTRTRTAPPSGCCLPTDICPQGVPICTPTINRTRTKTPTISRSDTPVVTMSFTSTAVATTVTSTPNSKTSTPTVAATTVPVTPRPSPTKPGSSGCGSRGGSIVAGLFVAGVLLRMRRKA